MSELRRNETSALKPSASPIRILGILILLFGMLRAAFAGAENTAEYDSVWIRTMFSASQSASPLPEFEDSYGVVFRDINGDGLPDLYVVRFRNLNRLFLNQGPGNPFQDVTIQSGLGGNLMPRGKMNLELGASAADFDNDGWCDVGIIGWNETTRLFRQRKDLQFSDVTREAGIPLPLDGNAGLWADMNLDGHLDLFITDEHSPNHLLLNDGRGHFQEKSAQYGMDSQQTSQGAAWADVDGDGFPDLYVCNWFAPDHFYKNMKGKGFRAMKLQLPHLLQPYNSNSATFGDIDNDGDLDLVVSDRDGHTRLYRNSTLYQDSLWQFEDVTESTGVLNPYPAYGCLIADLNNDGWQDLFFSNIGPNMLFLNSGGGHFRLAYQDPFKYSGPKKHYSTGLAVADFDGDGDLDLFVANKDTHSVLYENPLNNSNFLRIRVEGVRSNRDAFGTRIWLSAVSQNSATGRLIGFREIGSSAGYLSASEPVAHFGTVGPGPYRVRILFPSGKEIVLNNVAAGRTLMVSEYQGLEKAGFRFFANVLRTIRLKEFWLDLFIFLFMGLSIIGYTAFALRRYQWSATTIAAFLLIVLILIYFIFLIFSENGARQILLTQTSIFYLLALITTVFMEKIRQIEAQRYGYRKTLSDFSRGLISIKNNRELYQQLVTTVYENMRVQFCLLFEVQNAVLRPVASAGQVPEWGDGVALQAEQLGMLKSLQVMDSETLRAHFPDLASFQFCLLIPISRKDNLMAILAVGPRLDSRGFPGEDLSLLQILANQAAIAIENNFYIEETRQLIQKMTENQVREKYVKELEEKNIKLQKLYHDLQETQAQLIQSEKMASLGQLVAGVAHELNNPISYIYANLKELQNYILVISQILEVLTQDLPAAQLQKELGKKLADIRNKSDLPFIQKDIHTLIQESLEGSQRVKSVVQNLRNFSRLDEAELKKVDLHEGLESTLLLLNNEIKNRIQVHKEYARIPTVWCHPGHINQVFMNILHNATQAIADKGNIWIRTRQEDNRVVIEIQDDGRGIPGEILNKIFDPFFTTKPVGKGTGLGLSISYNIIKEHGGEIGVESTPGKGTTFRIILPVKHKHAENRPERKTG